MPELVHLIYASKSAADFSGNAIIELLDRARKTNHSLNVTGMLLYDKSSFLQVLEGEEDTVLKLYSKISNDNRHEGIVKIIFEAIPERDFNDWSMGYSTLSRKDLETLEGMNDFFIENTCLSDLDKGRTKKILSAFAKGRWRLS